MCNSVFQKKQTIYEEAMRKGTLESVPIYLLFMEFLMLRYGCQSYDEMINDIRESEKKYYLLKG